MMIFQWSECQAMCLTFLLMYVYNISPGHKLMYVLDVVM